MPRWCALRQTEGDVCKERKGPCGCKQPVSATRGALCERHSLDKAGVWKCEDRIHTIQAIIENSRRFLKLNADCLHCFYSKYIHPTVVFHLRELISSSAMDTMDSSGYLKRNTDSGKAQKRYKGSTPHVESVWNALQAAVNKMKQFSADCIQ